MRRPLTLGALGAAALSCSTAAVVNNTNNVLRATDVAFVCLDVRTDAQGLVSARPLGECALDATNASASGPRRLHALMIQQTRGELAVVDLAATSGTALLDNSPSSPGFSFQPTLALPTALAVDVRGAADPNPAAPPIVWVASGAVGRIQRIDARGLRKDPAVFANLVSGDFAVDGAPRDLVVDSVGGRRLLYATLPERGVVARFDVTDPLNVVDLGAATLGAAGVDGGVTARPGAVAVDARTHRLYVGDEGAPVVHVMEGFPLREVATIPFGARVRSLAVTGWTRSRCDAAEDPDHCGFAQYLYGVAIDDGAVRAWDLTRGALVRANVLPAPNPRGRRVDPSVDAERVPLPAPATAVVAISTADYDAVTDPLDPSRVVVNATAPCESNPCGTTAPDVLRGVFVGALLRTGALSVIDLDDYDAACRAVTCAGGGSPMPTPYRHIRHAPRAAVALSAAPKLQAAPSFAAPVPGGTQRAVISEASVSPVIACGDARTRAATPECNAANNFGVELARSGAVADAYAARNEGWALTWEGILPGLDQSGGAFSAEGATLRLDAPGAFFCARGVLAQGAAPEVVTIVGEPAPLAADRAICAEAFGSAGLPLNRDFSVAAAFQDRLSLSAPAPITADLVARCFPQATRFQVRAGGQWIVEGSRSGYLHAVRAAADGRCEVDPARQMEFDGYAALCVEARFRTSTAPRCPPGRACLGPVDAAGAVSATTTPVFANPFFCLQVFPAIAQSARGVFSAQPVARDAQLSFVVGGAYEPLLVGEAGRLPVAARYLPSVGRLYVVDTATQGLIEYRANPLGRTGRIFN